MFGNEGKEKDRKRSDGDIGSVRRWKNRNIEKRSILPPEFADAHPTSIFSICGTEHTNVSQETHIDYIVRNQ